MFLVSLVSCNLVCFLLALCLCFLPLAARNKTGLSTTRFLLDTANPLCLYLPSPDQWLLLPKLNQSWKQHWDFWQLYLKAINDRLVTEGKQVTDILLLKVSTFSSSHIITEGSWAHTPGKHCLGQFGLETKLNHCACSVESLYNHCAFSVESVDIDSMCIVSRRIIVIILPTLKMPLANDVWRHRPTPNKAVPRNVNPD